MIVINFKNYKTGKGSAKLAKKIKKYLPKSVVCVPAVDIAGVSNIDLQVYAQHIDSVEGSRNTGFVNAESVKKAGGKGTLLNHSEHKISFKDIKKTLGECKKQGLKVIVCASSLAEAKKLKSLKPYAIAFEDSKLISTGKSITKYNPEAVRKFVKLLKSSKTLALCGAGINSGEDYLSALKLGCRGVLIASAIANVKNPDKILMELK